MNREPTVVIAAIGAFLGAIAKAAVLLGLVDWDAEQLAGISLVIDTGLVAVGAILIRSAVTPTANPSLPAGTSVEVIQPGATPNTTTIVQ